MSIDAFEQRLDQLISLDIGGRGVEKLYVEARNLIGRPLVGAAAEYLLSVPEKSTVIVTTGSVSRAWLSPQIGENDGPAGLAAIVRALVLAKNVTCVVLIEETLQQTIEAIMQTAGLTVLPFEKAQEAAQDGSLATVCVMPFPVTDQEAIEYSPQLIDDLKPSLLFSTERVGRNINNIYYSMRGKNYGMQRARIDYLFDEALKRNIPTVAVGDGGNEIGMGLVSNSVKKYVKFGDDGSCQCGAGIGAVTKTNVLVTAACSNWGCYAIVAAMALRTQNERLLHTSEMEAALLKRGVDIGLINSVDGVTDANVDGIKFSTHLALTEMITAIVSPLFKK
ncbi:glutamate cyclase domain-containing protein [Acinetobacter sp.]|uniref:glutamate cyclase domain-containing protein n=1 Tax=Acinetobacter sp. TaxID=472 RepID=UPI0035AD83DB